MRQKTFCNITALLIIAASHIALGDEGWGDLTGRFVVKGELPALAALDPGSDQVCCQATPKNESLVVGAEKQVANVVVFLRPARNAELAIHPDYEQQLAEPVEFDNQGCAFTPHVALVRTGQTVILKNTDATSHSVKGELGDEAFNFILRASGGTQELVFKEHQRIPRQVGCSIHPFMRGWMLVRDDPYMAKSAIDGTFSIAKLPAGEHDIQCWHELSGYLKNAASATTQLSRRGQTTVTIRAGEVTDLGTIEIDAALLIDKASLIGQGEQ